MLTKNFTVSSTDRAANTNILMLPGLFAGGWIWDGVLSQGSESRDWNFHVFNEPVSLVHCLDRANVADVTDMVLRTLDDSEATGQMVLCGNSFGALVALDAAVRFPDKVNAIVLSGMPGVGPEVRLNLSLSERPNKKQLVASLCSKLFHDMNNISPHQIDEAYSLFTQLSTLRNILAAGKASRAYGTLEALDRLEVPALMIWGEHDEITPLGNLEDRIARWQGCQLKVVDGSGHSPMIEKPVEFYEPFVEFMKANGLNSNQDSKDQATNLFGTALAG